MLRKGWAQSVGLQSGLDKTDSGHREGWLGAWSGDAEAPGNPRGPVGWGTRRGGQWPSDRPPAGPKTRWPLKAPGLWRCRLRDGSQSPRKIPDRPRPIRPQSTCFPWLAHQRLTEHTLGKKTLLRERSGRPRGAHGTQCQLGKKQDGLWGRLTDRHQPARPPPSR